MSTSSRSLLLLMSVIIAIVSILLYCLLFPSTPSKGDGNVHTTCPESLGDSICVPREASPPPKGSSDDSPAKPSSAQKKPPSPKVIDNDTSSFLTRLKSRKLTNIVPLIFRTKDLTVADVDAFNNRRLTPLLRSICSMDYFRFVKLNLRKPCTLWPDDGRCAERDCSIRFCDVNDLPAVIVDEDDDSARVKEEGHRISPSTDCAESSLGDLNETISTEHEETMDSLFECTNDEDGQYIDLSLNPERFTGYRGETAHRVWKSIYEENCFFRRGQSPVNPFSLDNVCYEERIFYRAISGLHTSINIHLSAAYPLSKSMTEGDRIFTHNVDEFLRRFQGRESFLMNLYFLFLLEMRALEKAEGYLLNRVNWKSSGDSIETREAIKTLLKVVRGFNWKFNETLLFQREPSIAQEFAAHFKNITSTIMDCVACDKCRLWGKIQIHGLGTAFKILTHQNTKTSTSTTDTSETDNKTTRIHLTRHEITSLVNAISRLSSSIAFLEDFGRLLKQQPNSGEQRQATSGPFSSLPFS